MLPLYKLLSLFLRVFSRPLINLTKRYHASNKIQNDFIRRFFFRLGVWFNAFETRINRRYLKTAESKINIKTLSETVAIDKGIQFFYQIIFYSIAIGFPTYELYRGAKDTKAKEKKLDGRVDKIATNIDKIAKGVQEIKADLQSVELNNLTYELVTKYLLFTQIKFRHELNMINFIV